MVRDERSGSGRRGTEAQGTRCREGEVGHDALMEGKMRDTSGSQIVSTKLQKIAEQAARYPDTVFTTLAHLIDMEFLREAHRRTRKKGAAGVDGVTAKEYAKNLENNGFMKPPKKVSLFLLQPITWMKPNTAIEYLLWLMAKLKHLTHQLN